MKYEVIEEFLDEVKELAIKAIECCNSHHIGGGCLDCSQCELKNPDGDCALDMLNQLEDILFDNLTKAEPEEDNNG